MGTGLIDPVDDLDESNPPSHPELLDELAGEFARQKFDVKFLMRAICASRAYQLSSRQTDAKQTDRRLFARMAVKGLAPLEIAASLAQAVGDYEQTDPVRFGAEEFFGGSTLRTMVMRLFRNDNAEPVEAEATILQALALMNSATIDQSTSPGKGSTLAAVLDAPFLDTAGRIETLYLATLGRRPRPEETARLVKYVDSGGTKVASKPKFDNVFQQLFSSDRSKSRSDKDVALGDVFWALLNSTEFLTNH
jgi:hypothetical protein